MKKASFLFLLLFPVFSFAQYPIALGDGIGYIDSTGKVINQGMFQQGTAFSEGLAAVAIAHPSGTKRWFFVGADFTVKMPYGYDTTGLFVGGLCPVRKDGDWFYIGTNGLSRIDGPYTEASNFSAGFARVKTGDGTFLIDTGGNRVLAIPYEGISEVIDSVVALKAKGTEFWFLYHLRGDTLLVDSFYALSPPVNGIIYADRLGGHMFLDTKGNRLFNRTYIGAAPFGDVYGGFRDEKFWFLIDTKGKVKKDIKLLQPVVLNQTLNLALNYNGRWGYLSRDGRWIYLSSK